MGWGDKSDTEHTVHRDAQHQLDSMKKAAIERHQALRDSLKRSPSELEITFKERGVVDGDLFPIFLDADEIRTLLGEDPASSTLMIHGMIQLRPLENGENFVRIVQVKEESPQPTPLISPKEVLSTIRSAIPSTDEET